MDGFEIFLCTANVPLIIQKSQVGWQRNYGIGGLHLVSLVNESIKNHLCYLIRGISTMYYISFRKLCDIKIK